MKRNEMNKHPFVRMTKTEIKRCKRDYLRAEALCCPYCRSSSIEETNDTSREEKILLVGHQCQKCGHYWTEILRVVNITLDDVKIK
jgi:predicted Zn-ribbon and HTH transcriptional regulator